MDEGRMNHRRFNWTLEEMPSSLSWFFFELLHEQMPNYQSVWFIFVQEQGLVDIKTIFTSCTVNIQATFL